MQEVCSLGLAEECDTGITNLLKAAGCKDKIEVLREISSKAMATL